MTEPTIGIKNADPHEYVDLMIEVKNGQVVGCEFYGEGRAAEPVTEPLFFRPGASDVWTRGLEHVARRMKLALAALSRS